MKIFQVLASLEEGGKERHVLGLANTLASRGNNVKVFSAGGKLEGHLQPEIGHIRLTPLRKEPFSVLGWARSIARMAKREEADILHCHCRLSSFATWWASAFSGKPWILTAHSIYSLNAGLAAFPRASAAICVSGAVRKHLEGKLPTRTRVIQNGLFEDGTVWNGKGFPENPKFLFVGRLTRIKGLTHVLDALKQLERFDWILDVVGDGPQRKELVARAASLGLDNRIFFHGLRDDVREWMKEAGCLLFPSLSEGMGLSFLEAVQVGLPVIASDLEPIRNMAFSNALLVRPGDTEEWKKVIRKVLEEGAPAVAFDGGKIITLDMMAEEVEGLYTEVMNGLSGF